MIIWWEVGITMIHHNVLTIKELMRRPMFKQAKIVAGEKGINREIAWVHILEIPNATPFVNPKDLILTTGLGFQQNSEIKLAYIKELINRNAAGLCVEIGEYLPSLPQDMIDIANKHDFPLIQFNVPVRFVDITQDIHSLLINHQHQILKALESFSRKLQQLTLESSDINSILRLLYDHTSYQVIYYSTIEKNSFFPPMSLEISGNIIESYQHEIEKSKNANQETCILTTSDKTMIVSQPVICLGQTLSYVGIVVFNQKVEDSLFLMLDYVGKAIAHILLRKLFLEEKTAENHNLFINDILQHKVDNEEIALARIGLRSSNKGNYSFVAGIIEIEHDIARIKEHEIESRNQDILISLRSLLKKNDLFSLLFLKNNQIYILCIHESFKDDTPTEVIKKSINKAFERLKNTVLYTYPQYVELHIGFGQIKQSIVEATRSFIEAEQTLDINRVLPSNPFYEDIGIYQLLKGIPDKEMLHDFIEHHLGLILEFDKKSNYNLLETLNEYLKCQGSKQETAKRLFIHRQTLYYRLEKLEELLGQGFLEPEKRICLEMALRAHKIVSRTKILIKNK